MNQEEFSNLGIGDTIQDENTGIGYIVISKYGGRVIAATGVIIESNKKGHSALIVDITNNLSDFKIIQKASQRIPLIKFDEIDQMEKFPGLIEINDHPLHHMKIAFPTLDEFYDKEDK